MTLHRLTSGTYLCARRRWLYNTFHTSTSSSSDREQLDASYRKDFVQKIDDQAPPTSQKGSRRTTGPSVVENSKIKQHLDHIESTKHNIALEDVERYKPKGILDSTEPTYDQKYREIQKALVLSFSKPQLRRFLKLYELPSPPSHKGKNVFAELLMKQWGLEPLAIVQEERADWKENCERLYPMSPAYAFLFMGKDGADLLNLARRYSVHLSFASDPLSLRIQGLKGAVKQLGGYLKNFEDDIISETAQMPHGLMISSQDTQSISRLSGAHVEASRDGKLLITYRKSEPGSANRVKRLAVQAASKLDVFENRVYILGEPPSYVTKPIEEPEPSHSFYPFFPAQLSSSKFPGSSAFRLRRVGQWLRAGARYNMDGEDLSNVALDKESVSRIKTRLLDELSAHRVPSSEMVVTATSGHILFLAPSEQTTFRPPIPGNVKQDVVLNWAKENPSQVVFNPNVPKSLMTSWPSMQSQFQRIIYKALPKKSENIRENSLQKMLVLEILPQPVPDDLDSKDSNAPKPLEHICCQRKIETYADILLPSRATDIRISVSHVETIASSKIPKELRSFTKEIDLLTGPVDPPLTLTLDGVPYTLSSASHIRRDHRHSSKSPEGIRYDFVVETGIDPEDGQQSMVCKVLCANPSSDWNEFFTHCDHISMVDSTASEHPLTMMKPWFQDSDITINEGTQTEIGGSIDHPTLDSNLD